MFVLDSDHISILQRASGAEYAALMQRMLRLAESDFYWSIISFHEQVNGWHAHLQRSKRDISRIVTGYRRFENILRDFSQRQVLPFDLEAADTFTQLAQARIRVGVMDLRIAAIALSRDFTLLTRNFVDFSRVPRLKLEDWTLP